MTCRWCSWLIHKPHGRWVHQGTGKAACWNGQHTAEPAPGHSRIGEEE